MPDTPVDLRRKIQASLTGSGKVKSKLTAALATIAMAGCVTTNGGEVSEVLDNRDRYLGEEIKVSGILSVTSNAASLCDTKSTETCMNLAIPADSFTHVEKYHLERVVVHGVYADHEYKEMGGAIQFIPSRVVVSRIENP